jgi:hypothetical protein
MATGGQRPATSEEGRRGKPFGEAQGKPFSRTQGKQEAEGGESMLHNLS